VDVEPVADYIDWLGEGHCDIRITWRVEAVVTRITAEHCWTNLDDRRSASRVRNGRDEVSGIVIAISRTGVEPEDSGRVAGSRRVRGLSAVCACAVADEINDIGIAQRTSALERIEIAD